MFSPVQFSLGRRSQSGSPTQDTPRAILCGLDWNRVNGAHRIVITYHKHLDLNLPQSQMNESPCTGLHVFLHIFQTGLSTEGGYGFGGRLATRTSLRSQAASVSGLLQGSLAPCLGFRCQAPCPHPSSPTQGAVVYFWKRTHLFVQAPPLCPVGRGRLIGWALTWLSALWAQWWPPR